MLVVSPVKPIFNATTNPIRAFIRTLIEPTQKPL